MYTKIEKCNVCRSSNLVSILDFPKLPFTGIYVEKSEINKWNGIDQGLNLCSDCGHAQLLHVVDPKMVYDFTYSHRGSISPIASGGNQFFFNFLDKLFPGKKFERMVDIGCNDGYLLQLIQNKAKKLLGIDPIWIGKEPPEFENIKIKGNFIEDVNIEEELGGKADLIVSAHTFEHIQDPYAVLEKVLKQATDNATLLIEVPSFDTLLRNCRFDQIFHQHIQYFSLHSFQKLIEKLGGSLIDYAINYDMWGGTLLVAFKKSKQSLKSSPNRFPFYTKEDVRKKYHQFVSQLNQLSEVIQQVPKENFYGFGAAQMLPILAYHLKSDLSFLSGIYDDNDQRNGLMYPHLKVKITKPVRDSDLVNCDILITALDSARPILSRLNKIKPRRIFLPLNIL